MQSATTAARALAAFAFLCGAPAVLAQAFPSKPIRLVVGFTPGGGVDINARLLGPKLTEYLGQPVVVENRPGAGTNIANELVAKSPPDGYTLLVNTAALAINLSLYKKVNYEAKDFAPISILSMSPNILVVHTSVPVSTTRPSSTRDARSRSVIRARASPTTIWVASQQRVRTFAACRMRS